MCLSAILGIGSSLIGAVGANKAAKAQTKAADQQVALQGAVYNDQTARFSPYLNAGNSAQSALNFELGLAGRPTVGGQPLAIGIQGNGFTVGGKSFTDRQSAANYAAINGVRGKAYGGYEQSLGYGYRLREGQNAIEASSAGRGMRLSGASLQALQQNGQDYATNDYTNYLNRLSNMASGGAVASANQSSAASNFGTNASNAIGDRGNAQSAGYMGMNNAIQGGIQNGLGIWNYMKNLQPAGQ